MSVAAWALPQDRATILLTFLALLFAVYGVLSGVALETTRAVAAADRDGDASGPQLWRVAAVVSLCAAVAVLALTPLWREGVLHGGDGTLVVTLVAAVGGYGVHSVVVGAAAGRGWWSQAAVVISGEVTLRLVATLGVVLVGATVTSMGVASALGAFAWLLLVVASGRVRCTLTLRTDAPAMSMARRMAAALVAQGSSAVLVVGFPILLASTTDRVEYAAAAPLLLAISLTRAPVLLPLNALQGVAVSHLVRAGTGLGRLLVRLLALVAAVAVAGAGAAWLIGPWLMQLLFGQDYAVDAMVLALLTLAAGGTAALTLTGACAQALTAHSWYVAGWVVALVACVLLLQAPGSMAARSCLALGLAPLVGLVVHVTGLMTIRRSARADRSELADA
ncbi:membrane protein [Nocardioides flavus (ex Wang et al. 2016)]|uniref:Membrane protein n=2 Tax=Nocardioides flavus (ex Wang et al. 2016) TaxID=2058780 RepID=A0ABQ3HPP4_9ACTN|nr:membrane protein [Nocardioides flavus (ex Wang et al. 2016)]